MKYKFVEHTADLKIEAYGKDLEEVFMNSALALKEAISGKVKIKPSINKEIKTQGKDYERLLYNFLEEFLYLLDAEGFMLARIDKISIIRDHGKFILTSEVSGDKSDKYKFSNNVKAITYNEMKVEDIEDNNGKKGWEVIFVLDV